MTLVPTGSPCWMDLVSSDLEAVKPFYQRLFGWDFANLLSDFNNYHIVSGKHGPVGGAMQHNPELMGSDPGGWDTYFAVDDLQATIEKIETAGGKISVQPHSVENQGSLAFCEDPNGTYVGFWQAENLPGFGARGVHGYPAWFELHTRDFEKSRNFYSSVLPVSVTEKEQPPGSPYCTLDVDGNALAGIWDITGILPDEMPTEWTNWIAVDDCDETCALAAELGGEVVMDPEETENGRVATIQDPVGAVFNVVSPLNT